MVLDTFEKSNRNFHQVRDLSWVEILKKEMIETCMECKTGLIWGMVDIGRKREKFRRPVRQGIRIVPEESRGQESWVVSRTYFEGSKKDVTGQEERCGKESVLRV